MAQSPAHRFGQIIGDVLEQAIRPNLEAVAAELGVYLDGKGERKARGTKRKVAWVDGKGNAHDLDYVFEVGGTAEQVGSPRAFIEIAWRRYTKHSRNKAQEIQGAILPLAEHYCQHHPFLGVVLGGVFTAGSLNQLRSHGFHVLHFSYSNILTAFSAAGLDAAFDEKTPDAALLRKVKQCLRLTSGAKEKIARNVRASREAELKTFIAALQQALTRKIDSIYVLPLHGRMQKLPSVAQAIAFVESFDECKPDEPFARYEVGVRYSNGDEVRGHFIDKSTTIAFLRAQR